MFNLNNSKESKNDILKDAGVLQDTIDNLNNYCWRIQSKCQNQIENAICKRMATTIRLDKKTIKPYLNGDDVDVVEFINDCLEPPGIIPMLKK